MHVLSSCKLVENQLEKKATVRGLLLGFGEVRFGPVQAIFWDQIGVCSGPSKEATLGLKD